MSMAHNVISKFILLENQTANEKSRSSYLFSFKKINVLRGSLWFSSELTTDGSGLLHLKSLDEELNLKCLPNYVCKLSEIEYQFLLAIQSCKERYIFYTTKNKVLCTAAYFYEKFNKHFSPEPVPVKVYYSDNFEDYLLGNVVFLNCIQSLKGCWLGVDLDKEVINFSISDSTGCVIMKDDKYFKAKKNCGILVTLNRIEFFTDPSVTDRNEILRLLNLNDRVMWVEDEQNEYGYVRWCGILEEFPSEYSYGIECDNPVGRGFGLYKGKQLFKTKNKHAAIIPASGLYKVDCGENVTEEITIGLNRDTSDQIKCRGHSVGAQPTQGFSSSHNNSERMNDELSQGPQSPRKPMTSLTSTQTQNKNNDIVINTKPMRTNSAHHCTANDNNINATAKHGVINADSSNPQPFNIINKSLKNIESSTQLTRSVDTIFNETTKIAGQHKSSSLTSLKPNNKIMKLYLPTIELESMVQVSIQGMPSPQRGVVRWMGLIANEQIVGIELEEECIAATDGKFMDRQLFTCAPRKGYFTKLSRVKVDERFVDLLSPSEFCFGGLECLEVVDSQECVEIGDENELNAFIQRCMSKQISTKSGANFNEHTGSQQQYHDQQLHLSQLQQNISNEKKHFNEEHVQSSFLQLYHAQQQPQSQQHLQQQHQQHLQKQQTPQQTQQHHVRLLQLQKEQQKLLKFLSDSSDVVPPKKDQEEGNTCGPLGRNLGIQGHHNSCYLDATLFSMFAFNHCFDSLLSRPKKETDINLYDEIQKSLRNGIVNPLRLNMYVRADKVLQIRKLISEVSSTPGFLNEEKDPEEFLQCLFKETLKLDPLLHFDSGLQNYSFQLLVDNPSPSAFSPPSLSSVPSSSSSIFPSPITVSFTPTLQQLLETSMQKFNLKFFKLPEVLILQLPRFGKKKMYKRTIPSPYLNLKNLISNKDTLICKLCKSRLIKSLSSPQQALNQSNYCLDCLHGFNSKLPEIPSHEITTATADPQTTGNQPLFTQLNVHADYKGNLKSSSVAETKDDVNNNINEDDEDDYNLIDDVDDDELLEDAPSDVYVSPTLKKVPNPLSVKSNISQTNSSLDLRSQDCPYDNDTKIKCADDHDMDEMFDGYTLELFAVICIKTSHYVAFTKCGPKHNSPWLFFDSMSDRIGLGQGYNIPKIQICPEIARFLASEAAQHQFENIPDESLSEELRRFLCDGYICFYRKPKLK